MDDVGTARTEVGTTVGSGTEMSVESETVGIETPVGRAGTEGRTEEIEESLGDAVVDGREWMEEAISEEMGDGKTVGTGRDVASPKLGRPL